MEDGGWRVTAPGGDSPVIDLLLPEGSPFRVVACREGDAGSGERPGWFEWARLGAEVGGRVPGGGEGGGRRSR